MEGPASAPVIAGRRPRVDAPCESVTPASPPPPAGGRRASPVRLYVVVIPLLLLLGLAASLERRVHEALFVLRHGCRPDDYRWSPGVHGPAEPLPFPPEAAADAATRPR